jgi:hypothetical protein
MRIIIGVSVLSIAGLAGCASAGSSSNEPPPPAPVEQRVRIATTGASGMAMSGTTDVNTSTTANVDAVTINAPVDKVWAELSSVYSALGITTSVADASTRTIGNPSLKARRRLGTVAMTKYIDCGSTQGALSAETYELLLSIHTQLQSVTPNSTRVTTTFQSMGRPASISSEYRTCASTGALEKSIADLVRTRLSG